MTYTKPTHFREVLIEGATARLEESLKVKANTPKPTIIIPTPASINNPENYIILEGRTHGKYNYEDLIVSKTVYHKNKNWNQAHELLHQDGEYMLTIKQFVDFLTTLKSRNAYDGKGNKISSSELENIFNEITEVRAPWRAEWLDAKFEDTNILYGHRIQNGILVPTYTQQLEAHLSQNKTPGIDLQDWLTNANEHGLPIEKTKNGKLYYWSPANNSVARFIAYSDWALLDCSGGAEGSYTSLGVRPSRKKI